MKFAECIRTHGVSDFPDPNAKNDFDYGVSVTPAVWKQATHRLQGPAATGHVEREADPQAASASLRFAQCIRDNGVEGLS